MLNLKILFLSLYSPFIALAEYRIEYKVSHGDYTEVDGDFIQVDAGKELSIRCVFENVPTSNPIVWEVTSQAWKNSVWMDETQIGLRENTTTDGRFITEIYIVNAGAKDVGSYQCIDYQDDLVNIDPDAIYVYVSGDSLTPLDTSQVIVVETDDEIPCIPSYPEVRVSLSGDGEELTSQFQFDPRKGFIRKIMDTHRPTSFTCYFSYGNGTESVHVTTHSHVEKSDQQQLSTTLHIKHQNLVSGDAAELVCKVYSSPSHLSVEISWKVPALDSSRLLHKDDPSVLFTDRWSVQDISVESVHISTLTVMDTDKEDEGKYSCIAERLDGRSSSADMYVTVEESVELTTLQYAEDLHTATDAASAHKHLAILTALNIIVQLIL